MLVPLTAIVTTALPMAAAVVVCAKDKSTVHAKNKNKSMKSKRSSSKSSAASAASGGAGKSTRSRRSSKSGARRGSSKSSRRDGSKKKKRHHRSSKSGKKSSKSGKSASASADGGKSKKDAAKAATATATSSASSEKSEKSGTSSAKSGKSSKSSRRRKNRRLDSDAQKKMEKSGGKGVVVPVVAKSQKGAAAAMGTQGGEQAAKSLADELASIKHSSQLTVVPSRLQYQTLGGLSAIEMKNASNERKAYKVQCSDNALYRVNPVYGFAEPNSTVKIDVMRSNGEEKTDKLVLLTANAKDAQDPREVFASGKGPREMMVVPLVAA